MKYKRFPVSYWDTIKKSLDQKRASALSEDRIFAAFDADGTLWDTDLGENFFKWQIASCKELSLPKEPWQHYRSMKAGGDPRPAYLWLAQINSGLPLQVIQEWAATAYASLKPVPIFEDQMELIQFLKKEGVTVYIITASVKWAVEPGALALGLERSAVLGVATRVENGFVTSIQDGTITYREGKPQALLEKTKGISPFLASGNTMGDFELLQASSDLSLVVGAAKPDHELFKTETELRQIGQTKGWLVHQF